MTTEIEKRSELTLWSVL